MMRQFPLPIEKGVKRLHDRWVKARVAQMKQ